MLEAEMAELGGGAKLNSDVASFYTSQRGATVFCVWEV